MGILIAHDPPPPPPPPVPTVVAEAPVKEEVFLPSWAIGWSYGVEAMHVTGRDTSYANSIGLAFSRRVGPVQVRAEAATLLSMAGAMATSPGYGDRLGVALRYAPLAAQTGYDKRSGVALTVDAGAGEAWWFDRVGSVSGPYAMLGLAGSITIAAFSRQSEFQVLTTGLGIHAYAFDAGWSLLGSLELSWGR